MSKKCPKCEFENTSDSKFCKECGTILRSVRETDPTDVGPDPRSGRPSDAIPDFTKTMEAPKEELAAGSTFAGRYQIIEELGKGGMGRVYKVLDKEVNAKVALKLIKPEIASEKKTIERFRNELRVARDIAHKNVCRMYDLGKEEGDYYITMEYVSGEDLKSFIRRSGVLSVGKAISIANQVCEGLSEAHRLGVVHRDLKPQNIMIDKDGNARIMDFGIARSLRGKGITGSGVMIGTPEYMSPEQVDGKEADNRADIYSLGIILYEMVTGRVPFEGDTPFSVGVKQKSEIPRPPKEINDQIPEDLNRLILTCMEKDKEKRYQSVGDLKSDLFKLEQGLPTTDRVIPKKKPQTSEEITVTFKKRWAVIAVPLMIILAAALAFFLFRGGKEISTPGRQKIIVLPFENLGLAEDEYFADGIAEMIRSRLSALHSLDMISRDTAILYKKSGKTPKQIKEETAADYILGGTVLWDKKEGEADRVRITPHLTRALDDTQLWSDAYDRDIEDIFAVQSEIAEQVTRQLDIILLEPEIRVLEARQTENFEAYQAYLRGMDYWYWGASLLEEDLRLAVQMFELAVNLDPDFALAYGALSAGHSEIYHLGYDRTEERKSKAKAAADRMLELQPELPESHQALGAYYYYCLKDYDRALEELSIAEQGLPNNAEILNLIAYIRRRQGNFKESIRLMKRALELDPKNLETTWNLGVSQLAVRSYQEAEYNFDRTISLAPEQIIGYIFKALTHYMWHGDLERIYDVVERMPQKKDPVGTLFLYLIEMGKEDYQTALDILSESPFEFVIFGSRLTTKALLEGRAYEAMGKVDLARASFDSARLMLEAEIDKLPDDPRIHSALGEVYAALGRKEDALREGSLAMEIYPISMDAFSGPDYVLRFTEILVEVGEYEEAMDKIEYLLSIPSQLSVAILQNDPTWKPLHDHPRFKQLLQKYSK